MAISRHARAQIPQCCMCALVSCVGRSAKSRGDLRRDRDFLDEQTLPRPECGFFVSRDLGRVAVNTAHEISASWLESVLARYVARVLIMCYRCLFLGKLNQDPQFGVSRPRAPCTRMNVECRGSEIRSLSKQYIPAFTVRQY